MKNDALEAQGKLFHQIADKHIPKSEEDVAIRTFKSCRNGHSLSVTSVSIAKPDESTIFLYSTSKDGSIVKWDFVKGTKAHFIPGGLKPTKRIKKRLNEKFLYCQGHNDEILCGASSSDGKYMVSLIISISGNGSDRLSNRLR